MNSQSLPRFSRTNSLIERKIGVKIEMATKFIFHLPDELLELIPFSRIR